MYKSLKRETKRMLDKGQEENYWIYRENWYENKAELVHIVLCLSNTVHLHETYIVFGATETGEIQGVNNDENRMSNEELIRFLGEIRGFFVLDEVPTVMVETFEYDGMEIDLLIVENSDAVPYYLIYPYKDGNQTVLEEHIYMRVGVDNTPINEREHFFNVEELWKKRFNILFAPVEEFVYRLNNKAEWERNEQNIIYNTMSSDFKIVLTDKVERDPYYEFVLRHTDIKVEEIEFYKGSLLLGDAKLITYEPSNFEFIKPKQGKIYLDEYKHDYLQYDYIVKGTKQYILSEFFHDGRNLDAVLIFNRLIKMALIFRNQKEKIKFDEYVKENILDFEKKLMETEVNLYKAPSGKIDESDDTAELFCREVIKVRLSTAIVLQEMLKEYRKKMKESGESQVEREEEYKAEFKYRNLENYFAKAEEEKIVLSFSDVERELGFTLPKSAYSHSQFWDDSIGHAMPQAWRRYGYEMINVYVEQEIVTFRKMNR